MYQYADLILFKLKCPQSQCGHEFAHVIRDLVDVSIISCPSCNAIIDLHEHKRAIEHLIGTAAELDKLARKAK